MGINLGSLGGNNRQIFEHNRLKPICYTLLKLTFVEWLRYLCSKIKGQKYFKLLLEVLVFVFEIHPS